MKKMRTKLLDRKPLVAVIQPTIFKMKKKKVLDKMKKLRYNKRVAWSGNASKDRVVLWKLNNATWIICDSSQMLLKHRLIMNISNRQFLYWASFIWGSGQKRFLEPIKVLHILWRVWSWLRTNAGGVLNTCKSNETIESLLLKVEWQTGE